MDLAVAMAQHANMRADDRRQMAITQATLSLDLGDYGKARDSFSALLPAVKDKAESAQILRYLSTAQLALGDVSAALDRASQALQAATAVRDQREILLAHLAHARAMSLAGLSQESIMEIESVIEQFVAAGYQPDAIDVFRARRDLAEASMRSGNLETGLQQLRALPELGTVPKVGQEVELAVTFDLIGCALRDTGRPKEALAWHLKSAGLLDDRLEATHPIRLRNMLYQLAATWRLYLADDSVQASFKQALASYLERFPPKSIWRTLSSGANFGSPCDEQQKTNCDFIL